MATAREVMKKIADNEVKFVDLRFTDIRGKEQHITVPISHFDEDRFTDGQAFDGSSMAGWRGVQASDMLLIPDPETAVMDPFREEPTLILSCDVVEPGEGQGYERDPRSIARRAEAYLQASGVGDVAFFGPEPEFFIFDSVTWKQDMSGSMVNIDSEEAHWSSDRKIDGFNSGHRPGIKATGRFVPGHALRDGAADGTDGGARRGASPRGGRCRPVRDRHEVRAAGAAGRLAAAHEVRDPQRGTRLRQDGHLHAQAAGG